MLNDTPIKTVLDTNVVISSAISSDGNPAKIFEMLLLGQIKNYTSEEIIREIQDVIERERIKEKLNPADKTFIIENFKKFSEKIIPNVTCNEIQEDSDDNKFLECALTANVSYIVSGDEHLLRLKEFKGIKILSPAGFVQLFNR